MSPATLYQEGDLIAAEATPHGRGGISVIRVSGPGAGLAIGKLFDRSIPEASGHRFGRLFSSDGDERRLIDEVVVSNFSAPHSYTGEDVVEISTHGSPLVVAEALDALYRLGVRPARPGEFTLRAFLNGRIDLTQAEAVADLVAASSRQAADQARCQLSGGVGRAADEVSGKIAGLLTLFELELDFVEEDVELANQLQKRAQLHAALKGVERMLEGYRASRRLREGVRVAITGPPNVGKSSLFNGLLGEERAIVHPSPGTTRDVLQAQCLIGGISFELFDTAGIRVSLNEIEDEGVRRAVRAAENAELTISLAAADLPLPDEFANSRADRTLRVLNKVDLARPALPHGVLPVSAHTGEGLDRLREALYDAVTAGEVPWEGSLSRERHYRAVCRAREALIRASEGLDAGETAEIIAEELRESLNAIDELTGRRRLEGLLDEIFAGFCIGK